jgi:hypothetical protein
MSLKVKKKVIITQRGMEWIPYLVLYTQEIKHKIMAAQVELTSLNISGGKPVASNVMNGAGTLSPCPF